MTIREALSKSPELPRFDREVLLSHVLNKERTFLLAHDETSLLARDLKRYLSFLTRAEKNEPVAYIIGEKEFYGRKFFVGPGVLIPRPETEILVEHAVENISKYSHLKKKYAVIDVGTGSGAIITSVYLSLKPAQRKKIGWYALEKESIALRFARRNAKQFGIEKSVRFTKSNLLSAVEKKLLHYDRVFIVANLPYLSVKLYQSTELNVRDYEPKSALISGANGLAHYRELMKQLLQLRKHGVEVSFSFEISPEQTAACSAWLSQKVRPHTLQIITDLAGKNRIITGILL